METLLYEFRPVGTSDSLIAEYSRLLSSVFSKASLYSEEYLRWQYFLNPEGPVCGIDAWFGDELVGHYVTVPVRYQLDGQECRGLLSLNTATRPDHQGRGLFTEMAMKTYDLARELHFRFVIGVANQNSSPGFVRKLEFQLVTPLTAKIGVGFIGPGKELKRFASVWTEERLAWRLSNPSHGYTESHGHVFAETDVPSARALLSTRIPENSRVRCGRPTLWIGADDVSFSGLFLEVPRRLRPSPLNLIYKDLEGQGTHLEASEIRFELLDFDAY